MFIRIFMIFSPPSNPTSSNIKKKGPLIGAGFPISCVGVISVVINSPNYSVYGKQTWTWWHWLLSLQIPLLFLFHGSAFVLLKAFNQLYNWFFILVGSTKLTRSVKDSAYCYLADTGKSIYDLKPRSRTQSLYFSIWTLRNFY